MVVETIDLKELKQSQEQLPKQEENQNNNSILV